MLGLFYYFHFVLCWLSVTFTKCNSQLTYKKAEKSVLIVEINLPIQINAKDSLIQTLSSYQDMPETSYISFADQICTAHNPGKLLKSGKLALNFP